METSETSSENRTTITDIDIPFGRLVVVMLKFMLASIPALIIFYGILFLIALVVAMFFGGITALLNGLPHH